MFAADGFGKARIRMGIPRLCALLQCHVFRLRGKDDSSRGMFLNGFSKAALFLNYRAPGMPFPNKRHPAQKSFAPECGANSGDRDFGFDGFDSARDSIFVRGLLQPRLQ